MSTRFGSAAATLMAIKKNKTASEDIARERGLM
jgi:hypothetical protein